MLKKYFTLFGGLSYRTPELLRTETIATDLLNIDFSKNKSVSKRRGLHTIEKPSPVFEVGTLVDNVRAATVPGDNAIANANAYFSNLTNSVRYKRIFKTYNRDTGSYDLSGVTNRASFNPVDNDGQVPEVSLFSEYDTPRIVGNVLDPKTYSTSLPALPTVAYNKPLSTGTLHQNTYFAVPNEPVYKYDGESTLPAGLEAENTESAAGTTRLNNTQVFGVGASFLGVEQIGGGGTIRVNDEYVNIDYSESYFNDRRLERGLPPIYFMFQFWVNDKGQQTVSISATMPSLLNATSRSGATFPLLTFDVKNEGMRDAIEYGLISPRTINEGGHVVADGSELSEVERGYAVLDNDGNNILEPTNVVEESSNIGTPELFRKYNNKNNLIDKDGKRYRKKQRDMNLVSGDTQIICGLPNADGRYEFKLLRSDVEDGNSICRMAIATERDRFDQGTEEPTRPSNFPFEQFLSFTNIVNYDNGDATGDLYPLKTNKPNPNEVDLLYVPVERSIVSIEQHGNFYTGVSSPGIITTEGFVHWGNSNTPISAGGERLEKTWEEFKRKMNLDVFIKDLESQTDEQLYNENRKIPTFIDPALSDPTDEHGALKLTQIETTETFTSPLGTEVLGSAQKIVGEDMIFKDGEDEDIDVSLQQPIVVLTNATESEADDNRKLNAPNMILNSQDVVRWAYRMRYTDNHENIIFSPLNFNELRLGELNTNNRVADDEERSYKYINKAVLSVQGIPVSDPTWNIDRITSVAEDSQIGSSLKVEVYQTQPNGNTYFFLGELDIEHEGDRIISLNPTMGQSLTKGNQQLGFSALLTPPNRRPEPPPKASIISSWRGQMVLAGIDGDRNSIRVADIQNIEGFDLRGHVTIENDNNDPITAVKELGGNLFVFSSSSIHVIRGNITLGAIRVDRLSDENIGSVGQDALLEYQGEIWFIGKQSIYSVSSRGLTDRGQELSPLIDTVPFDYELSSAYHDEINYRLYFNLAVKDGRKDSRTLVYNTVTTQWSAWSNFDFTGGMVDIGDTLYALESSRGLGIAEENEGLITRLADGTGSESYVDKWTAPEVTYDSRFVTSTSGQRIIPAVYTMHWEAFGEPSLQKKLTRLKVFALPDELQTYGGHGFDLNLVVEYDYKKEIHTATPTVHTLDRPVYNRVLAMHKELHPTGWGRFPWGMNPDDPNHNPDDSWGESGQLLLEERTFRLPSRKCRSIRLTFKNDKKENIFISALELEGNVIGQQRLKGGR